MHFTLNLRLTISIQFICFSKTISIQFIYFSNLVVTCCYEVEPDPPEDLDTIVLVNAEQVHQYKSNRQQHANKADREEELRGHKES